MLIFISTHDPICWFVWTVSTVGPALNRKKGIVKTDTYHWGEHFTSEEQKYLAKHRQLVRKEKEQDR